MKREKMGEKKEEFLEKLGDVTQFQLKMELSL
jgi:hypothetical protein